LGFFTQRAGKLCCCVAERFFFRLGPESSAAYPCIEEIGDLRLGRTSGPSVVYVLAGGAKLCHSSFSLYPPPFFCFFLSSFYPHPSPRPSLMTGKTSYHPRPFPLWPIFRPSSAVFLAPLRENLLSHPSSAVLPDSSQFQLIHSPHFFMVFLFPVKCLPQRSVFNSLGPFRFSRDRSFRVTEDP